MKSALNIFCILAICWFCVGTSRAQTTKAEIKAQKAADLKRIIDGKNYIFKANIAMPMNNSSVQISGSVPFNSPLRVLSSGSIPLTSPYDLKISNDTLTAFLPYYGVAFMAPYNSSSTEGGIKFKSTKFEYTVTQKKKGNLVILIKPQDLEQRSPSDVQRMVLTVGEGGWANLQIILTTRQPITFTGLVEEIKPKPAS